MHTLPVILGWLSDAGPRDRWTADRGNTEPPATQ